MLSCSLLRIPLNDKAGDAFKFPSFGLFDVTSMPSEEKDTRNWCTIRVNSVPGLLFKVYEMLYLVLFSISSHVSIFRH